LEAGIAGVDLDVLSLELPCDSLVSLFTSTTALGYGFSMIAAIESVDYKFNISLFELSSFNGIDDA